MLIKSYSHQTQEDQRKYSPAEIVRSEKRSIYGNPVPALISTSIVERSNLAFRTGIRRFTRLTNAFSKCYRNHEAAVALFVAYYNYCRVHSTIKTTPAVATGLTGEVWSVATLLEKLATH